MMRAMENQMHDQIAEDDFDDSELSKGKMWRSAVFQVLPILADRGLQGKIHQLFLCLCRSVCRCCLYLSRSLCDCMYVCLSLSSLSLSRPPSLIRGLCLTQ
jgi:hypothetical protein